MGCHFLLQGIFPTQGLNPGFPPELHLRVCYNQHHLYTGMCCKPNAPWPSALSGDSRPQGFLKPELLGGEFTHLEFPRRVQPKELGQRMLYRDQNMTGW